jgi:hypothetical protein
MSKAEPFDCTDQPCPLGDSRNLMPPLTAVDDN